MKMDSLSNQVYIVAVNEANLQSHEFVTSEHFLYAALLFDLGREIIEKSGGNIAAISSGLQNYFDHYVPKTADGPPTPSAGFERMIMAAAAQAGNSENDMVNLGNLIAAMFTLSENHGVYIMEKNGVDRLTLLRFVSHDLKERLDELNRQKPSGDGTETAATGSGERDVLNRYAVNLTEKARKGELDPLIGREDIIERSMQILCRRLKNNPVHVGDPGVGKTAIVEGLAQAIASGKTPDKLKDAHIYSIDMAAMVAGTKYRGDFEERFIRVLNAAEAAGNAIIYIDEIHNAVGAGMVSGSAMDAAGILKPYLSKGRLRFIGSTTFDEYRRHFEKDGALNRRFQKIDVTEPDAEETVAILKGIISRYEEYHNVGYPEETLRLAVDLTVRFIKDKKLPDKAIDVIDEAGARISMEPWEGEEALRMVTPGDIERTVASMAKIPESSVSEKEKDKLKTLGEAIKASVFGQDEAVDAVVEAIKASRAGLSREDKPVASLLFVGPTGVGKTEIARQLALCLEIPLIRFDMSEYQEAHAVAKLTGSPPGYVGYEQGGMLTDSIRKTPHAVLLLDEIEKAHADILNVLLQVMDYGVLTDNTGKKADFRNIILIMTSNAGARDMGRRAIGFDEAMLGSTAIAKEVERVFSPEFRNRLDDIIPFHHIDHDMAARITDKALGLLAGRLGSRGLTLEVTDKARVYISSKGLSKTYGAREIMRVVDKEVRPLLVDAALFGQSAGEIWVDYGDGGLFLSHFQ